MIRSEISQARNSISYYLARFRVSILFDAFRVIFLIFGFCSLTHMGAPLYAHRPRLTRARASRRAYLIAHNHAAQLTLRTLC